MGFPIPEASWPPPLSPTPLTLLPIFPAVQPSLCLLRRPPMAPCLLCDSGICSGGLQIVPTVGRSSPHAASSVSFYFIPQQRHPYPSGLSCPPCGLGPRFCCVGSAVSLAPGGSLFCFPWRRAVLLPCPRALCCCQHVLRLFPLFPPSPCFVYRPQLPHYLLVRLRIPSPNLCPRHFPLLLSPLYLSLADLCVCPRRPAPLLPW